jgi:hypothetical protein
MAIVASIGLVVWVLLAAVVYAAMVAGARADESWASLTRDAAPVKAKPIKRRAHVRPAPVRRMARGRPHRHHDRAASRHYH